MQWTHYWAFLLLIPIALIALKNHAKPTSGVIYSYIANLQHVTISPRQLLRQLLIFLSSIGTIIFLTLAAARPQTITMLSQPNEAHNIMLVLDLSGSMRTRDFFVSQRAISRLDAVQLVVSEFIEQRKVDRLGLIVFGSKAYLQCPLTNDYQLVLEMLKQLEVGLAGDATAIGEGLGLALKRLAAVEGDSKALVILTDGVNNAGSVDPIQAATIAKDLGIKIHTVGVGRSDTASNISPNIFSPFHPQQFDFDEKTLRKIAESTGGLYFNAMNLEELQKVYQAIDQLEKSQADLPDLPLPQEHFSSFALLALALYFTYLLTNNLLIPRLPW